ncbi:TIGR02281 family clan AA aspartic protease [Corticibacter populi]|uniref:TIGR02281 family clan AA aspartic protease n=1 Tax=Corticibacter populi TaxID=1550736 RepID=A0A3M6QIP6_9BURK|nr:retropepsin-like aspartic protease [Corticibacter populi]RMX02966.1 TIGR02281 family clan AA aspartic protease [Corticibacter populi]RZS33389.1 aspartyl protease family protein [Corticibacter populi]
MARQAAPTSATRPWLLWLVWIAVIGALYLVMNQLLAPPAAIYRAADGGELQLPRHRDGHFYVDGSVNGVPVRFMVDTGASIVSVSDAVARAAGLEGGRSITFQTANGPREGRVVRAERLSLGAAPDGFTLQGIEVGTGLAIGSSDEALLGQNVLRHFDVSIDRQAMVLRPRR